VPPANCTDEYLCLQQCLNIYKTAVVQKRRIDTHSEIGAPGYVGYTLLFTVLCWVS
jgi:hypothetical protein